MKHNAKSIRPFIGAKDFALAKRFYHDLGFQESILSHNMSYFMTDGFGFYLQDADVRDWIDNTMVFLEVEDVGAFWDDLVALDLTARYPTVRIVPIREDYWGSECFIHDPSGILWHVGQFNK